MAKSKKKRVHGGKLSRFSLGRRGEIALAVIGVIVLGIAAFFAWSLLSPALFKPDPAKAATERKAKAENEARWSALLADGTVLRVDEGRQDLHVDAGRWEALGLSGQNVAAASALAHFDWRRCFVYAAGTGEQLGWFTPAEGYKKTPRREP